MARSLCLACVCAVLAVPAVRAASSAGISIETRPDGVEQSSAVKWQIAAYMPGSEVRQETSAQVTSASSSAPTSAPTSAPASAPAAQPQPILRPDGRPWRPGRVVRVSDERAGVDGYFRVYVPTDYDAREKWPVVLYYHGLGGRPDIEDIRDIADGKSCIIVGMSYFAPGSEGFCTLESEDTKIVHFVLAALKERLSVDDKKLYAAGFSKGGFYSCELLRLMPDVFAGAIVFGGGTGDPQAEWQAMAGKEVFIGCGAEDRYLETAQRARDRLTALGAKVTYEEWPELGHTIGDTTSVQKWLAERTANRPRVDAAEDKQGASSRPTEQDRK